MWSSEAQQIVIQICQITVDLYFDDVLATGVAIPAAVSIYRCCVEQIYDSWFTLPWQSPVAFRLRQQQFQKCQH